MEEDKMVIKFSKTEYIKQSIKECKKILFQQIIKYIIIISALLFMAICLTNSQFYLLKPKIVNNIFVYGLTFFLF